eukprot:CAMPEP_0179127802 /NCGR_PEP_ID=MMETSP0796-20121207/60563_1 /TAXON_ID=73915 /ORGANISM="Pyrodinium bahamense, Strain pbaha01" /LENGTH=246 /DNA_ID=CAMNT_0020826615 /DNA_START=43 /DNA_END=780 /DNA_ORIENTATION=+
MSCLNPMGKVPAAPAEATARGQRKTRNAGHLLAASLAWRCTPGPSEAVARPRPGSALALGLVVFFRLPLDPVVLVHHDVDAHEVVRERRPEVPLLRVQTCLPLRKVVDDGSMTFCSHLKSDFHTKTLRRPCLQESEADKTLVARAFEGSPFGPTILGKYLDHAKHGLLGDLVDDAFDDRSCRVLPFQHLTGLDTCKDQVKGGPCTDVIIRKAVIAFEFPAAIHQALLARMGAKFAGLDLRLDAEDG